MRKQLFSAIALFLLLIPLISADFWGYYSPTILDNEWVKFGILFFILFASIYTFINNRMNNMATSGIIAACLSLLLSIAITRRGILESFLSETFVDWLIIFAIIIGLVFIYYKFGLRTDEYGRRRFSFLRFFVFLVLLLILIWILGDLLPETMMYGPVEDAIDWIENLGLWAIIIGFIVLIILWRMGIFKEGRRYYREGKYKMRGEKERGFFGRRPKPLQQAQGQQSPIYRPASRRLRPYRLRK